MFNYFRNFSITLKILTVSLLLFGSVISPNSVFADSTITVTTSADELNIDGDCSIREAIQAANTDSSVDACAAGSGIDTITIPSGVYTLNIIGDGEDANLTGDLDITDSLIINGATGSTTIQAGPTPGSGIDSVFNILGAISVNISGVMIANGQCSLCVGGGIYNDGGALTVVDSTFSENSADIYGGGIYNFGGILNVTNSIFTDNSATCGGGIYNDNGILTITNSNFSHNSVTCEGGGIYSDGVLQITDSVFTENSASDGGAIYNFGTVTVVGSTFLDNDTTDFDGGGIFNGPGNATITNSTFSGNSAGENGGGVFNIGNLTITNSTFSGNYATTEGGGVYNLYNLYLKNTILANSTGGSDCYNDGGDTINANINNLIETNGPSGSMCGVPAITADPMLGIPTGSPAYFSLNILSPAMNAGNDIVCASQPVGNTSQNGVARPQGTHCDIGSFEKAPAFLDVPFSYWANTSIEQLYNASITSGCTNAPLNYCPDNTVTRAQMAIFLLKGIHGSGFTPPAVGGSTGFADVATNYWAAAWIKQLAAEGITSGCTNGNFCPDATVTRAQLAVLLLKAKNGSSYTPSAVGGSTGFGDVPTSYWSAAFIKQLAADGITSGCGGGNYCPDTEVTRAQTAVFLVKAFGLP